MYRNLDFLVKSSTVVGVLLVSALMLYFFLKKIVAVFGRKIIKITLKHLAAIILWFLLQLKIIF